MTHRIVFTRAGDPERSKAPHLWSAMDKLKHGEMSEKEFVKECWGYNI